MQNRVVITQGSVITPIGHSKDEIVSSLWDGKSGVQGIVQDDLLSDYIHSGVYGTVDSEIHYDFQRKNRKTMGPVSYYACQVVREVLEASGLDQDFISSGKLGVAFGSTHGSPSVQRDIYRHFFSGSSEEFANIGAVDYLKSMVHTTAVNITKMFGITGRVISSSTACTTSSQSIGFGYEAIKFGLQKAMICGGADEYDTTTVAVFDNLLACSTAFNETPQKTPRPFDSDRDGLVVGEGAGALLLEEYEFARQRNARILGEVVGFSCNNNGGDLILPNPQGIKSTISLCLEDAQVGPEQVDYVSAHATGTKMGDVIEAQAISSLYGENPYVSGLKSYMGHTMGSCGIIETMLTLYMLEQRFIAPTLNLERIDERCSGINHVTEPLNREIHAAVIQNFAFGGVNTCLMLKQLPE